MSHPIQCSCGVLKGHIADIQTTNRLVCYCKDCQAYAHFLGRSDEILDQYGGTDIVQTLPKNISFTQGTEVLACLRLTPEGLLRWYATCCCTPIGATLANHKISFVGLVHNCLDSSEAKLDSVFGSVSAYVHTDSAQKEPKPQSVGFLANVFRNITRILRARIDGSYRSTPFFETDTGRPIAAPKILSAQEHEAVMSAVANRSDS